MQEYEISGSSSIKNFILVTAHNQQIKIVILKVSVVKTLIVTTVCFYSKAFIYLLFLPFVSHLLGKCQN